MNAHNTNPMIEPIRTAIHFATLFMRLRLEMDALPRLTDMLLFVFIVRHFLRLSTIEVLLARWQYGVRIQRRAVRLRLKNTCAKWSIRRSLRRQILFCVWRFLPRASLGELKVQPKGKRIALHRTFSITSKQDFLCWWYSNKLERRVRVALSKTQTMRSTILLPA